MFDPTQLDDVELNVLFEGMAWLFAKRASGQLKQFDDQHNETLDRLAFAMQSEHRTR